MCGRFTQIADSETISRQYELPLIETALTPRYNVAPTQPVLAVRQRTPDAGRELTFLRWGLIPSWAKEAKIGNRMINARGETVAEKPSFRAAFKRRRCLIPADGFYEWQKLADKKQPIYISAKDGSTFALAGLWEAWHDAAGNVVESCTVITTRPNELLAPIHNRMPVIIEPADYSSWLNPDPNPELGLHLLRPYPAEKMQAYPVSTTVNNPRNDTPECIQPIG